MLLKLQITTTTTTITATTTAAAATTTARQQPQQEVLQQTPTTAASTSTTATALSLLPLVVVMVEVVVVVVGCFLLSSLLVLLELLYLYYNYNYSYCYCYCHYNHCYYNKKQQQLLLLLLLVVVPVLPPARRGQHYTKVSRVSNIVSSSICTVIAEGSVCMVWHKSLANLLSITVDPLFPSFFVRRKLMKMQFFARSFSIFILISPIIRAKHHTAMRHDCLHAMPRFHITSAQDGDFVTKANYVLSSHLL